MVPARIFLVSIVDDDESVRESLPDLVREFGYAAKTFASAEAFLASGEVARTDCVLLDIGLPDMSGPDLQRELRRRGHDTPIIFMTAQGHDSAGRVLQGQAVAACLFKPFSDAVLRAALDAAFGAT